MARVDGGRDSHGYAESLLMTGLLFLVNKVFKKKLIYSDGPREVDVSWADINVGRLEV